MLIVGQLVLHQVKVASTVPLPVEALFRRLGDPCNLITVFTVPCVLSLQAGRHLRILLTDVGCPALEALHFRDCAWRLQTRSWRELLAALSIPFAEGLWLLDLGATVFDSIVVLLQQICILLLFFVLHFISFNYTI